ncbi:retrotransposon protein, putative, ty1-copia subclass [Tanacetum coccineum]
MLENGFKINECDKCVYVNDTSSGYVILCLYVNDNDKIIRSTKDMLKSKFDMKDMGLADVILGIRIPAKLELQLTPIGALRSPRRELRNELKYVQSGVKMNEISCPKVRHVKYKIWELEAIPHRPKREVDSGL